MNIYEIAFITTSQDKAVLKGVEDMIGQFDGKVTQKDSWGEREFAYKLNNLSRGFYHIWNFTIEATKLKDLKNRFNLDENLIRYLVLKVD